MTTTPSGRKIRVLLIDDHLRIHEIVTTVLAMAADIELVGHGSTGQEAILLCGELAPDIVLMDVIMPEMSGAEATRQIHRAHPDIKILVLSGFQDEDSIHTMLANGAVGYVLKGSIATDLLNTIRMTHLGNTVFSAEVAQVFLNQQKAPPAKFGLTDREIEVLKLVAMGLNNGEIGAKLSITQSTVKYHTQNILQKMKVGTRAEAIVIAAKSGLI